MKHVARLKEWPRDLVFDVPHALRHGRIAKAVAEGKAVEFRSSASSLRRYGASNEARRGCKEAKKELTKAVKKISEERKKGAR
jgi:hypothetical protein